jgi:dGTPase
VLDIVDYSWGARGEDPTENPVIGMNDRIREATSIMHEFLYRRVYNISSAQPDAENARRVVRNLYHFFQEHREKLPPEYCTTVDDVGRGVVDYIAGMTDRYALMTAQNLSLS